MSDTGNYENQALVETVFQKTRRAVADMTSYPLPASEMATVIMAILEVARDAGNTPVRLLDFGGAAGIHAFSFRHAFPHIPVRWAVVETAPLAARCQTLEDEGLRYFSSIGDAEAWLGQVDVVNCSGSIPYVPEPEATMGQLLATAPRCISISRTSLCRGERHVRIQRSMLGDNGPGPLPEGIENREITYPVTLMNRSAFFAMFEPEYRRIVSLDLKLSGMNEGNLRIMQFNCLFLRSS